MKKFCILKFMCRFSQIYNCFQKRVGIFLIFLSVSGYDMKLAVHMTIIVWDFDA